MSEPATVAIWPDAVRLLGGHAVFGHTVREAGPVRVARSDEHPFVYLVRAIVYQQLAGAAARTIHGRLVASLRGAVTPEAVLASDPERLRSAGLSGNKLRAILDLAARARSGEVVLDLDELAALDDEAVIERLTRVRGVGVWTAQMFLMFRLHRPDVWPVLDLGVRNGWARLHGLETSPTPAELTTLGEPHRPWRSPVAWYCWRALEIEVPQSR